jgi:3-hydroxyacyl-CoA dehydrogenase/3-hydroxy-2-methylbutyryl-CoA dehydrogenase
VLTPGSPAANLVAIRSLVSLQAMRIDGSAALVVGGASGLGEAAARALHARGGHVLVADLDTARGEALAAELGERAAFAPADVTRPKPLEQAVALAAAQTPGGLRIAINCAGIGHAERLARPRGPHATETFERVVAINLVGSFHVLRLAGRAMLANDPDGDTGERGVIVNTASIAAYDGQIGQVAYAASKGGVVAMTLPAARDLAGNAIRVCAIAPGLFDTPLLAGLPEEARTQLAASIPFPPRLGLPAEFAELACHIVANPMLNGEVIRLDGALRMAPR